MPYFSVHDAKADLSLLITHALAGHEVIITQDNVPLVRLMPVSPRGIRCFGAFKGRIAIDADFEALLPEGELDGWNS